MREFFQRLRVLSEFKINTLVIGLLCLSLQACLPVLENQKNSSERSTASNPFNESPEEDSDFDSGGKDELHWFFDSQAVGATAQINESHDSVVYLRGDSIHEYLNSHYVSHCLVISYPQEDVDGDSDTEKTQLRVRAAPFTFNNPSTGTQEKLFRIDIPEQDLNENTCSGTASWYDSEKSEDGVVPDSSDPDKTHIGYDPTELCPNCQGVLSSHRVSLYRGSVAPFNLVKPTTLDTTTLRLRVDISNNSTQPSGSCSDSDCQARGFDCCLDGQCVNDGEVKSGVQDHPDYDEAMDELTTDPLAFLNYPDIFFICPNSTRPSPSPDPGTDPVDEANERLQKNVREYHCLEEGKKSSPDYGAGECSLSSYTSETNCENNGGIWTHYCSVGFCSDASLNSKGVCEAADETWDTIYQTSTNENGLESAHEAIILDVWERCGCDADPFPTEADDPRCPDFGLKALFDEQENIEGIACETPDPTTEPTPFQELNTSVPARSAPHRFYDENGKNYENPAEAPDGTQQEGKPFAYIDGTSQNEPDAKDFSMNAILGQMNIRLSQARPAKVINVEYDMPYVISATSGYYTPCPSCDADSWFDPFKPYPQSSHGNGLQGIGFISNRSAYEDNRTLGNYADTVFGRACWVPPTMIPFSHRAQSDVDEQRRDRLQTQAALFVNGYQRDWYGFNYGALIGSFDGVSWFSIGDGRRVLATSEKLYLAINAPYADLASATDLGVHIVQDLGGNSVARNDYDPTLEVNSPKQNHGATCRQFHQCETDVDCVTQLGWEYTCADVTDAGTRWPQYTTDASEEPGQEDTVNELNRILTGGIQGNSTKRCIYRGAGSICKQDWSSLSDKLQKQFRCAPNFYCMGLDESEFNSKVARSVNNNTTITYGQEADVLGRPLNYIKGVAGLPDSVQTNIAHNAAVSLSDTSDLGLCRPGKELNTDLISQHESGDNQGRTDFISQVSSCDSRAKGDKRYETCPAFGPDGNYLYGYDFNNDDLEQRQAQNMCGAESQYSESFDGSAPYESTFENIEAEPIRSLASLLEPKVARDACFRRAGTVCHTDLDCSPNRLHAQEAQLRGRSYFGETIAEKEFWTQNLVCGQAAPRPSIGDEDFGEYSITANRCSRPIGNDFTMYTEYHLQGNEDRAISVSDGDVPEIVPSIDDNNKFLRTDRFPSSLDSEAGPMGQGRYSRYDFLSEVLNTDDRFNMETDSEGNLIPQVPSIVLSGSKDHEGNFIPETPIGNQWVTLNKTGKNTCSGGGWVRKFADGSHDWTDNQRLRLVPENFQCLNYISDVHNLDTNSTDFPSELNKNNYELDQDKFCLSPGEEGCIQYPMMEDKGFDIETPKPIASDSSIKDSTSGTPSFTQAVNTTPVGDEGNLTQEKSHFAPYMPTPYGNPIAMNLEDGNPKPINWVRTSADGAEGVSVYLPSYIGGPQNVEKVEVQFVDTEDNFMGDPITALEWDSTEAPNHPRCVVPINPAESPPNEEGSLGYTMDSNNDGSIDQGDEPATWCMNLGDFCEDGGNGNYNGPDSCSSYFQSNYDVLHVKLNREFQSGDWAYAGIIIHFNPMQTKDYVDGGNCSDSAYTSRLECLKAGPQPYTNTWTPGSTLGADQNFIPGNNLFYNSRLGRLELLGIPQIAYEPLYCSSDRDTLVDGIFDIKDTSENPSLSRADFESEAFVYNSGAMAGSRDISDIYGPIKMNGSSAFDFTNSGNFAVLQNKIDHEPIFSDSKFICCRELGLEVDSKDQCCSNFATENDNEQLMCALPNGTDLNVYFNKFVSSEGTSDYLENAKLTEKDFVPETGEPKFNDDVYSKLRALGETFCEDEAVRRGGSTGEFYGEPNNGYFLHSDTTISESDKMYNSIIDSSKDSSGGNDQSGNQPEAGTSDFLQGFRWRHHFYCDRPE